MIRNTLLVCSIPVLAAGIVVWKLDGRDRTPYVPGQEVEGITRSLERRADDAASGIHFTEVTADAGIDFVHFPFARTHQLPEDMGSGLAWGDYDADGWPDLFLVNFAAPVGVPDSVLRASQATDRLFRNRGDGTFEDVTDAAGVGVPHRGMGAAWGDADGDGDADLFVTAWGHNRLWENLGDGRFRDISTRAGVAGPEGFWAGAAWGDADRDGDLDLYVCGYVQYVPEPPGSPAFTSGDATFPFTLNPSSYPPQRNLFYVNQGDGTFREAAAAAGILGDTGRSLAAAWVDFDADGWLDLYVANDVSDNALYHNQGDGTFTNISYAALVADYRGSMGIAVGDWDGDLDLDLFLTHWIAQENALYTNLTAETAGDSAHRAAPVVFGDDADRVGLGQIALDLIGWGTEFADFDHDGWLDLVVANGSTFQERNDPQRLVAMDPHLYWNRGPREGFFEIGAAAGLRTQPPGVGRGAAVADYDGDGDLDLAILRHGGRARLLRNDSRKGHAVELELRPPAGHAAAWGSRIVVHAGGRAFLRIAGPGPSYLSQSADLVHVGLGEARRIDSLRVEWFAGGADVWRNLEVDGRYTLAPGQAPRRMPFQPARSGAPGAPVRRAAGSEHAVVADVSSPLTPEQRRRFWDLKRQADRAYTDGHWAAAESLFAAMSALDPRHEDALYARGNCLLELGRHAEALACWRRLLAVAPASARAWVQIGIVHTLPEAPELFDLEAALDAFRNAHDLNPEESRPLVLWGEAAVAAGHDAEARRVLEDAAGMNPGAASPWVLRAYLAWKRGESETATQLLARAASTPEATTSPHGVAGEGDTRSRIAAERRRRAAARRLFATCVTVATATPPAAIATIVRCIEDERRSLPTPTP